MTTVENVANLIVNAFSNVKWPGAWCLVSSNEGSEPSYVVDEFRDKTDWRTLDAKFLDQAPKGLSSALSFFSDEAFRFYLPAYLLADLDNKLEQTDIAWSLIHGLDNESSSKKINPRRYGERTWRDHAIHQFSIFSKEQRQAIHAYLQYKIQSGDYFNKQAVAEAIRNYWSENV